MSRARYHDSRARLDERSRLTLITLTLITLTLITLTLITLTAHADAITTTDNDETEQTRFAMIIGANIGLKDEELLRFAERDALQVSEVLARFGDTPSLNQVVLLSPEVAEVKSSFRALRRRIESVSSTSQVMLTVYYSGHADVSSFHLRAERLTFKALKSMLNTLSVPLKIIVIDACHSGAFTRLKGERTKGAKPSAPFRIKTAPLEVKGVAVISSSSPQEDSQESDISRGGIFTQHLVTGLMGAADRTGDREVSLNEIYEYTYRETVKSTSDTRAVQHPNYALSLYGEQEVVLTKLTQRRGFSQVSLSSQRASGGVYLLIPTASDLPLSELNVEGTRRLLVHPGRYLIRYRDASGLYEQSYQLRPHQHVQIDPSVLRQIPYGESVRRGRTFYTRRETRASVWALNVGSEMLSPLTLYMTPRLGGGLQLDRYSAALSLHVKMSAHHSVPTVTTGVSARQLTLHSEVGIGRAFDLNWVTLTAQLWIGAAWIHQRFDREANTTPLNGWAGSLSPQIGATLPLGPSLFLKWMGGPSLWFIRRATEEADPPIEAQIGWGTSLALGFYL